MEISFCSSCLWLLVSCCCRGTLEPPSCPAMKLFSQPLLESSNPPATPTTGLGTLRRRIFATNFSYSSLSITWGVKSQRTATSFSSLSISTGLKSDLETKGNLTTSERSPTELARWKSHNSATCAFMALSFLSCTRSTSVRTGVPKFHNPRTSSSNLDFAITSSSSVMMLRKTEASCGVACLMPSLLTPSKFHRVETRSCSIERCSLVSLIGFESLDEVRLSTSFRVFDVSFTCAGLGADTLTELLKFHKPAYSTFSSSFIGLDLGAEEAAFL
mmetsp:Transcript_8230/g.11113  ORF Transcript_8230/g.11113 Transcript_8230/m.11113 type:complete len:273 (-) Transcript_8230:951-1769(-)